MLPVLLSIGGVSISSFGLFLALGFLVAVFVAWRIANAYDLNEGKILDLAILTFFGGIISARILYVILNGAMFEDISRVFMINLYPGLTFWGGLLGSTVILKLLTLRAKLNFWQIADIAAVGLMIGLAFGSVGCFLGGCEVGIASSLPFAVSIVGFIGKRFPISAIEAVIFLLFFVWLWKSAIRFHFHGKIFSLALILLGLERFFTENLKGDSQVFILSPLIYRGQIVSLAIFIIGFMIYYYRSKRNFLEDVLFILQIFTTPKKRDLVLQRISKSWYNTKIGWSIKLSKTKQSLRTLPVKFKRKLNVKPTPRNYQ